MRVVLTLTFLGLCSFANATDYYISSSGDDMNNSGLSLSSPWKTIDKVNSIFPNLNPGDRILFKKGETFFGTIKVVKSGLAGANIIIGAYGTGEKPVITGYKTISTWSDNGSGIFSAPLSAEKLTNMVIVNGKQVAMGRFPDAGSNLSFESFKTSPATITDNGLGNIINWAGAEAVINVNDWSLDRCLITGHSGDELTYTNLGSGQPPTGTGRYFFIQNDKRCVSTENEWYHSLSENKFYIFGDPSAKSVKVSCLDILISNIGYDYITIDGLNLSGAISFALYMPNGSTNCTVQNCTISYIGESGIRSDNASYHTYDNNYLSDINRAAIYCNNSGYFKITNNSIQNIGINPGGSYRATQNDGLYLYSCSYSVVQYNNISNTGYNGIFITGSNTEIKNNIINFSCMLLNDGGGIYTSGSSFTGRVFSNNIILNSGIGNKNADLAEGIYLDEYSANVTVKNNTIANCKFAGIKNHKGYSNIITYNTVFNNGTGIFLQNSSLTSGAIHNLNINNNIIVASEKTQIALRFYSRADDIPAFGIADYNYYTRPVDDDDIIYTYSPSTGSKYRQLTDWQIFTKQDMNSQRSPVLISDTSDIDFYYNTNTTDKIVTLAAPMMDITGRKYSGTATLQPYTSIVLFVDPNPSQPSVPVLLGSVIENATPSLLVMTYSRYLAVTTLASSAFTVKVNGTDIKINSASVSGNKVNLVLAEKVSPGDNITVTYSKPSTDPLKSSDGEQINSFSAQPVRNNCSVPLNQIPVVSIKTSTKGDKFTAPASIIIEVNVTDPDGTIIKVELYNGTEKISEITTMPYNFTLKDLPEGSYCLTAIATDNMKSSSTSSTLEFQVTGYNENSEFFNLYPNPNNGNFSINFTHPLINEYNIEIINLSGRTVYQRIISAESVNSTFDLSHLNPGTYILIFKNDLIIATQKFIKV